MSERLVLDIETPGLRPNFIYMVGILNIDTDVFDAYVGDDVVEGIVRAHEADMVIGHHILGFDIKVMERLLDNLLVFDRSKIVDTLDLGRKLCPWLKDHKLKTYGNILGFPKLEPPPFDHFTEEMIPYCERDCRLNKLVFDYQWELLESGG